MRHKRAWFSVRFADGRTLESTQFEQGEITRIIPRIGETYKHGDAVYTVVDVIHSTKGVGDMTGEDVEVIVAPKQ